ncbi:MAG: bifunctional molybdenum cofactor biosynthesis protein MoaC/MoaB [Bacteroidetes bacterium]|nr:bifunctional molybdenum cofactor biosynthesis protein MoaC/MoaB [Bacteroidota bacterium]
MKDITHKSNTLRIARARAIVAVSQQATIKAIQEKKVPKGDVFEMARAAGFLGIKKTPELIPDCHPIPVEHAAIDFKIEGLEIHIEVEVKTIYKTGVEVEAMHGASTVALTIYDMLKPLDQGIEIKSISLLEKRGGKTDFHDEPAELEAVVIVCSDSISAGKKEDNAGKVIMEKLEALGMKIRDYVIIPDDVETIRSTTLSYTEDDVDLILITGGTGMSPTDVTPEALETVIEREIPGIMEAARAYGQDRTPYSMLSRGIAGLRGRSMILALPGSTKGAGETIDALFPHVLHVFKVLEHGYRHLQ